LTTGTPTKLGLVIGYVSMSISVRGARVAQQPKGYFFKKVIEAMADPWCAPWNLEEHPPNWGRKNV
jgi:hypothetical protein